ncbi:DNA-binding transcriptional LysR family regulator [Bradyrhizobium sp. LM3.6]
MTRKLPPLNALRVFETAARSENFTQAAKRLNVSQGAVSRHIAQLEAFLGLRLFVRGQRDARLTAPGEEYARSPSPKLSIASNSRHTSADGNGKAAWCG